MCRTIALFVAALLTFIAPCAAAQLAAETSFTYQGRLEIGGLPYTGTADLAFSLWDAPSGGDPTGPQVVVADVPVEGGLFSVEVDFGASMLRSSGPRYLEVFASTPMASETLAPRQRITPTPFATQAAGAEVSDSGEVLLGVRYGAPRVAASAGVTGAAAPTTDVWQAFVPGFDGLLDSIVFRANLPGDGGTFELYLGEGTGGTQALVPTTIQSNLTGPGGWLTEISIDAELEVSASAMYTARLITPDALSYVIDDNGGNSEGGSSLGPTIDLEHTVYVRPAPGYGFDTRVEADGGLWAPSLELSGSNLDLVDGTLVIANEFPSIKMWGIAPSFQIGTGVGAAPEDPWELNALGNTLDLSSTNPSNGATRPLLTHESELDWVGLFTDSPRTKLHAKLSIDHVQPTALGRDQVAFTGAASTMGLYSNRFGLGSAFTLAEFDTSGAVSDKWTLDRDSSTAGSSLHIRYGVDEDHDQNPELLTVTPDGDVGIGTTAPVGRLGLRAPDQTDCSLSLRTGASYVLQMTQKPDSTFVIKNGGQDRLFLETNGRLGIGLDNPQYRLELPNNADVSGRARANRWDTYSSARYKRRIETIHDPIDAIARLRGVSFAWKPEHGSGEDFGFIAEEVAEVFPGLVALDQDGVPVSLDYSRLVPIAVEAIKAQQAELQRLDTENRDLKARLDAIERSLDVAP